MYRLTDPSGKRTAVECVVVSHQLNNTVVWFLWFVLFIWLVSFNQTNQTNQMNQTDQISRPACRAFP